MKPLFRTLVVLLACAYLCGCCSLDCRNRNPIREDGSVFADDFKTINGKEYKDATVKRVEPDGMSVEWSNDSAVALVTLEARSGPWDIFLFELRDGKVVRSTNLL